MVPRLPPPKVAPLLVFVRTYLVVRQGHFDGFFRVVPRRGRLQRSPARAAVGTRQYRSFSLGRTAPGQQVVEQRRRTSAYERVQRRHRKNTQFVQRDLRGSGHARQEDLKRREIVHNCCQNHS